MKSKKTWINKNCSFDPDRLEAIKAAAEEKGTNTRAEIRYRLNKYEEFELEISQAELIKKNKEIADRNRPN